MFRNYLTTAVNLLLKNKLFSVINIVGLSIGLAACLLIVMYVLNETSYDKHWENGDRIHRVISTLDRSGDNPAVVTVNSMLTLPALREYFAEEIEASSQSLAYFNERVFVGERPFQQNIVQVEKGFLDIFELDVLAGSLEATLDDPASIALSEEVAQRFFGDASAVGQVVALAQGETRKDYRIGAVYREPRQNTVVPMPALRLLGQNAVFGGWMGPFASADYVLLREGVDAAQVSARLAAFTDQYVDITTLQAPAGTQPSDRAGFQLQPIADVYLHSPFEGSVAARGSTTSVLAFSAIAVLVLLIGCINFTILSTAKATQRAREVAMRKTLGAGRGQLIWQFLGESFLLVLLATALGWALMELLLPVFEALVARDLAISYGDPLTYVALLGLVAAVGLVGGLYPAFVLSHFKPAAMLKGARSAGGGGASRIRFALTVFQFSISIALMVATAVIYVQVQYSMSRDPGFNRQDLLIVQGLQFRPAVNANKQLLKERVARIDGVRAVSLAGHQPMQKFGNSTYSFPFTLEGSGDGTRTISLLMIDENFFRTYEVPVVAGREFDIARDANSRFFDLSQLHGDGAQSSAIVNVSAARMLGFADPARAVGAQISTRSFRNERHVFPIVGVVADTQFFTLRAEGRAEVYINDPVFTGSELAVRYQGSAAAVTSAITGIWNSMMGAEVLSFGDVEQSMAFEFARETVESKLLIGFSLLAIVIACLGLYGSAAFTVDRRTKEIGIRKVLGAEVREIVTLLVWQFSKPVLLANIVAWPVALWVMLRWLQRFPYQIDTLVLIPLCILAGALALSIAWLTVAGNTLRVATAKPVLALRYE